MLFAEVAGGGCHDSALANYNFAVLFQGLPDVIFAYEVGRLLDWF